MSQAAPTLVNAIASIFAHVLGQPEISADADFFDLGGDSLAAATLMMGLESVGVRLPVAALIEAPTPSALSALVTSGAAGEVLPLVTVKPGGATEPVFLLPGAGGSVLEMVLFARQVNTQRTLFGLQALDKRGSRLTVTSIEALADYYLPFIRVAQPHGPYTLAGYSMGGLVALELAQRLQAAGDTAARVIMIDTLTPIVHFPLTLKLRFWGRRLATHLVRAGRLRPLQAGKYLSGRVGGLARDLGIGRAAAGGQADQNRSAETRAFLAYRPRRFDGSIAFIQAESVEDGRGFYPDLLWSRLARNVHHVRVPGDHWSILSTSAEALAREFAVALS